MKRLSFAAALAPRLAAVAAAAVVAGAAAGAGCSPSTPTAPHGAPHLAAIYWTARNASVESRVLVWSPPQFPDSSQVARPLPFVSELDFVFDRRLDGNRIEDTVTVNGVTTSRSKDPTPITADPAVPLTVLYNSAPFYGGSTSFVLVRPQPAGLPSGATVTFAIDRSAITSPYDEALAEPDSIQLTTADFAVQVGKPAADGGTAAAVAGDYRLPLLFTNRTAAVETIAPFVHARVRADPDAGTSPGDALPVALLVDATDASVVYLAPAARPGCPAAWPAGATVDVTVDAGLPDAFGVPLAAAATGSFTVRAGAGCGESDGGAD